MYGFLLFASVLWHFHMVFMEMCFDVLFVTLSLDLLGGEMMCTVDEPSVYENQHECSYRVLLRPIVALCIYNSGENHQVIKMNDAARVGTAATHVLDSPPTNRRRPRLSSESKVARVMYMRRNGWRLCATAS